MKKLAQWLLRLSGWRVSPDIPAETKRCVMIAAPHTSNWDLWYARLGFFVMGIPVKFTIKQEWMRFPFGGIIRAFGGLGIDRRPVAATGDRPSYVEAMVELFRRHPEALSVMITPEGTRSRVARWKTGFYFVALQARVPICLGYLDYPKKLAGVGPVIHPSGDIEADMRRIMAFYLGITGRWPEKFSIDERYVPIEREA
jgi:1-acyl-sn-glycerol-3-phosphate acyltransferase